MLVRAALAAVSLMLPASALAQTPLTIDRAPGTDRPAPKAEPVRRPSTLDDLFARLEASRDEAEAKGIASLIERRFAQSGSPTADLLLARASEAIEKGDPALAVEILDRVSVLKPDWAEVWSRRAIAFHLLDDPASALADLRQVLSREPRHYEALAALGHIEMAGGREARALEAYRRALALHPHMPKLKDIVERLSHTVDGRSL
jgi:tetratricopeptide (TPR) repeat protein